MAKQKFDGLVEAVHYAPDGQVVWVRAYLRRGPTFSDWVLVERQKLVEMLKGGKKFVLGARQEHLASTFTVTGDVRLAQNNGREVILVGNPSTVGDCLEGAPLV
jgi:hypothetical protein